MTKDANALHVQLILIQEEQEPKEGQEVSLPQEEPQPQGAQGLRLSPTKEGGEEEQEQELKKLKTILASSRDHHATILSAEMNV